MVENIYLVRFYHCVSILKPTFVGLCKTIIVNFRKSETGISFLNFNLTVLHKHIALPYFHNSNNLVKGFLNMFHIRSLNANLSAVLGRIFYIYFLYLAIGPDRGLSTFLKLRWVKICDWKFLFPLGVGDTHTERGGRDNCFTLYTSG